MATNHRRLWVTEFVLVLAATGMAYAQTSVPDAMLAMDPHLSVNAIQVGGFSGVSPMNTARGYHSATLLPNGKVLVAGGLGHSGYLASAELYDPANNVWNAAASLDAPRIFQTATLLSNGKVLVAGGSGTVGILASAETYDPASNSWSAVANLGNARSSATATILPGGKVLVAGGSGTAGVLASAELYDPVGNTWNATASLGTARSSATATSLPGGWVLVVGGIGTAGILASTELYDPASNSWSAAASLGTSRYYHTATLLSNGKVLVAGGNAGAGALASAELYDPASNSWSAAGTQGSARELHTATLLPDGTALVVGGDAGVDALASAEIYDPLTNAWNTIGAPGVARELHTATLLQDGSVLVAGGSDNNGSLASAEIYDVPATGPNYQGLWWNSPADSESGWGINFAHQGDTIFATWFTYAPNGAALWLSATATRTGPGVYSGDLVRTGGTTFSAFDPTRITRTPAGTVTFTFFDANHAQFHYVVTGIAPTDVDQTKFITRQQFGPMPTCAFSAPSNFTLATNYQDLWWNLPAGSESGWGINFAHEGDTIFATWFTYDLNGAPLWLSMSAPKTGDGVYEGDLYRTAGARFDAFNPAAVTRTKVGTAKLSFADGSHAIFAYTVTGVGSSVVTQSKTITREIFATPGTICQ